MAVAAVVAVHGSEDCEIVKASYGDTTRETFRCVETTPDPRLNGTWEAVVVTVDTGGGVGMWTAEPVLTNRDGTWRGTASGTVTGMDRGDPRNLGVLEWVGEGGYAGLTYHEFISGPNGKLETAGWIEPTQGGSLD